MQEEEKELKIYHKIEAGKKIRVFKTVRNDKSFYKVQVTQKNYDNSTDKFYIGLTFKKGIELSDPDGKGIDIIIKCAYENFRKNPADAYNPIMYLMVTDFKLCEREEQIAENALNEYNETIEENEINIDDSFLD